MSITAKDIIIMGSTGLEHILENPLFNGLLLTASFGHMGIIAANSCHDPGAGETSMFCGKVWDQCRALNNGTVGSDVNCTLRKCLQPGCEEVSVAFSDRPVFAIVLYQANFWMRWVYTAITALRMMAKGLVLRDESFIKTSWSMLDLIVVILAWLNVPFVFGNLMFLMVIRGAKVVVQSSAPFLTPVRIQMNAIGLGLYKIFIVFLIMNLILAFVSLLGISLVGSKGDFHNRCAVPVITNRGGNITFAYEPLVPERPCRMDHLYSRDVERCYSDVWTAPDTNFTPTSKTNEGLGKPGCQGTCGSVNFYQKGVLGTELNLDVEGVSNLGNPAAGDSVYCIGPDFAPLDKTQFPPSPAGVKNGNMKDYVNANLTSWPSFGNNDPRNFDDIGHAAIVLYTIFYRNGWTGPVAPTVAIGSGVVIVPWIVIMVLASYYLLNITVSITCDHYSKATVAEDLAAKQRAADAAPPQFDEDDDGGGDDEDEDEDEDDDPGGAKSAREKLLDEMKSEDYPWCGRGCDCFTLSGIGLTMARDFCANFIKARQAVLYGICRKPCNAVQDALGNCFRACCHAFIRCSIQLVFPYEKKVERNEDDDDEEQVEEMKAPNSVMSRISVLCMLGCMLTQGLQFASIASYKCACSDAQVAQLEDYGSLRDCTPGGDCPAEFDNPNGTIMLSNQTCVQNKCLENSFQGYACYNPRFNHVIHAANLTGGLPQPAAVAWVANRTTWCNYGMLVHFVLYGWALIFLLELCSRFLAHQGWQNFFTNELERGTENFKGLRPNFRNIVDSICILATVVGILLTEITLVQFSLDDIMGTQVLLAGVAFTDPMGDSTGFAWQFKLLRLATLVRIGIRTSAIAEIPAVAVILRGFRGIEKVLLGIVMLLLVVFISSLIGKELFDYGYSMMQQRFEMLSNFQDLPSSILPLMQIMTGSGWYEYARTGTNSIGLFGFVFFCLYYFVVFFQFQRIFIAIIVQNFELDEDEKLQAQQLILELKFEEVTVENTRDDFFGPMKPGQEYDSFSFNRHYRELLRGAKLSLRELIEYSEHLASGTLGFSSGNEVALAGDDIHYEDEQGNDGEEEDEVKMMRDAMAKIRKRLTINPQDKKKKKGGNDDDYQEPILTRISRMCRDLVDENEIFLMLLLLVIIASVFFAVYTTFDEDVGIKNLSNLLSIGFLGFFLAEMALKMIGYGLFGHGKNKITGYFHRKWCQIDFLLVLAQAFDVFTALFPEIISLGEQDGVLRGMRAVRSLRLLVALKKIKKETNPLTMIMAALGASFPAIMTLLLAVIFVMFVYALIGMDQYAGLLSRCISEDELDSTGTKCRMDSHCSPGYVGQCPFAGVGTYAYCTMDKQHCFGNKEMVPSQYEAANWKSLEARDFRFLAPRQWSSTTLNFDSLYEAIFTIFSIINKSKIDEMLVQLLSVSQRDMAPKQNSSPLNAIFMFSLLLFVGIFVSQIVIGMIMTNLRLKSGLAFHQTHQMQWPATKAALDQLSTVYSPFMVTGVEEEPDDLHPFFMVLFKIRSKARGIRDHWRWELLMSITVIFNCVLLGTYYYDQSGPRQEIYFWGGFACFVLYCLEFLVNMIADAVRYITVFRNQFDVVLTALTALDLFVLPRLGLDLGLASLRMFRLLKLLYRDETFTRLMEVIMDSLPQAIATVAINFVVIFIFAALGTNMFTVIKEGKTIDTGFGSNFRDFGSAAISVFKMSTGASWGDTIVDLAVSAPACTPFLWRPVDLNATVSMDTGTGSTDRIQNFEGLGVWNQVDLYGNVAIPSDCGQALAAYPVFLLFIFINNYILLPTFIASIIASYFQANLRDLSLISAADLKKYQESWIDMNPEGSALTGKSFFTFKLSSKSPKIEQPYDFARFNSLIEMLCLKGCRLGINRVMDGKKYKMALDSMKKRGLKRGTTNEYEKKFTMDYVSMCVMLLSISEKTRPVTIVDILRRQKAEEMLRIEASRKAPRKPKPKGDDQHASKNLADKYRDKKFDSLTQDMITYSYNLYVMLDQLARVAPDAKHGETNVRLTPEELKGLKELVDENDEDLLIYFEEYVEKSGPVYEGDPQWKAFCRFGAKAKDVFSRSKKVKKGGGKGGDKDGGEGEDGEEGEEEDEEDEGEEGEGPDADDDDEDEDDEAGGGGANRISIGYGEALEDENGVLDLQNWSECVLCGEPVDNSWERCPTCGKKHPAGKD